MITNSLFSSHWRSSSSMGSLNSIRNLKIHQKSVTSLKMTSLDFASLPSQTSMVLSGINAWSVNGASLNSSDLASSFFAASLFPYLAMLFFLSRKESKTPSISFFGFSFLLAFVAATIPAGIYAKYEYHDILANVDWLHGLAESLLTVTNILIITGFRQTRSASTTDNKSQELQLQSNGIAILGALFGIISLLGSGFLGVDLAPHIEPQNALSLPTWMVHSSSILEWLIAMTLIWDHAYTSSNPRWKGMTIAMIPAHVSRLVDFLFQLRNLHFNLYVLHPYNKFAASGFWHVRMRIPLFLQQSGFVLDGGSASGSYSGRQHVSVLLYPIVYISLSTLLKLTYFSCSNN